MSWLSLLFPQNRKSAQVAKQRLQIVISQERSARNSRLPEYLPALQRELQLVVAKYVDVPPREVSVRFARPRHPSAGLEVRIELPQPAHA
ncbi:MAG: cell division topological specificity factor MinE [Aquincola sp.]|nr:cell division topological specificity factor MinE [Aquincola sp.]MDH4289642.1 cell division topological specificity factor MinE [Aquincola sp.]MDH5328924.1 cell division topological specificity factor MinE [Aquincola sp.]